MSGLLWMAFAGVLGIFALDLLSGIHQALWAIRTELKKLADRGNQ